MCSFASVRLPLIGWLNLKMEKVKRNGKGMEMGREGEGGRINWGKVKRRRRWPNGSDRSKVTHSLWRGINGFGELAAGAGSDVFFLNATFPCPTRSPAPSAQLSLHYSVGHVLGQCLPSFLSQMIEHLLLAAAPFLAILTDNKNDRRFLTVFCEFLLCL